MTKPEFKPSSWEPMAGDLVNVTFQTRLGSSAYHDAIDNASVVERVVSDPSKDPVGTVRDWKGHVYIRSNSDYAYPWQPLDGHGGNGHDYMRDSTIIGYVPGTPAEPKGEGWDW